jgi:hypothetical protein
MNEMRILEVPIAGMDCAECTLHVQLSRLLISSAIYCQV